MRLILASSSPRRRELLTRTGLPFTIARPDIDESVQPGEAPDRYVARLSQEKAQAVHGALPPEALLETLIVAADTTVALDTAILGKPETATEATSMLTDLRGREHVVYTGVTVCKGDSGVSTTEVDTSQVVMRAYTDEEIARYVASGEPFDKAGGYGIQSTEFRPVAQIAGCYVNVAGLPLCRLCAILTRSGLDVPNPPPCDLVADPVNGCRVRV